MKNILVAVALAATVVTVQADAASDVKAPSCAIAKSALDEAIKTGDKTIIDTVNKAYAELGCLASPVTPPVAFPVADCAALKASLDAIKSTGVQTAIDGGNKTYKDAGCGAEALYGSLAAVAVAIYATTF